ncbi:unnamed protein product [Meganyctiphanes norvegica]|uniref:Uncharacterized protein n=1 Tax=Meganyctiphanes norvegica TaxID=48144 RepID=A0AAV2PLL7_MEGNR
MDLQGNLLEESLMKLMDPSTTPENALQLFSSPCFAATVYKRGNTDAMIFLAYFKFMMIRLPDACVDGIWEDILNKAFMYTRYLTGTQVGRFMLDKPGPQVGLFMLDKPLYMNTDNCAKWLQEALSNHCKCPNPYTRLKLFRILRLTQGHALILSWEPVCSMFIHTINEIKPYNLYPSSNKDESLFNVEDLTYIIFHRYTIDIISTDIIAQIQNKNERFDDCKETRFTCNCIQLIEVFAVLARSISDPFKYYREIRKCFVAFKGYINHLVCRIDNDPWIRRKYKPRRIGREWFGYVVSRSPFRHYAIQTVHVLISIFINMKERYVDETWYLRFLQDNLKFLQDIAGFLGVCNKTFDVPRGLFYRQIHGLTLARQNTMLFPLLLKNWSAFYSEGMSKEDDNQITKMESQKKIVTLNMRIVIHATTLTIHTTVVITDM